GASFLVPFLATPPPCPFRAPEASGAARRRSEDRRGRPDGGDALHGSGLRFIEDEVLVGDHPEAAVHGVEELAPFEEELGPAGAGGGVEHGPARRHRGGEPGGRGGGPGDTHGPSGDQTITIEARVERLDSWSMKASLIWSSG